MKQPKRKKMKRAEFWLAIARARNEDVTGFSLDASGYTVRRAKSHYELEFAYLDDFQAARRLLKDLSDYKLAMVEGSTSLFWLDKNGKMCGDFCRPGKEAELISTSWWFNETGEVIELGEKSDEE